MLPDATAASHIMTAAGITDAEIAESTLGLVCRVPARDALGALEALRDSELDFRVLIDLLGSDTGEGIEVTYHLRSITRDEELYVKVMLAYDGELHSAWNLYASALMPEREIAELLGLSLAGHPNPKRLFTVDGTAPLLRKSVPVRSAEEVRAR